MATLTTPNGRGFNVTAQPIPSTSSNPQPMMSTPQVDLDQALRFQGSQSNVSGNRSGSNVISDADKSKIKDIMSQMVRNMNDSAYIYPGIALVVASILLIVVLFQSCSTGMKVFSALIYLVFLAFTIFTHRC